MLLLLAFLKAEGQQTVQFFTSEHWEGASAFNSHGESHLFGGVQWVSKLATFVVPDSCDLRVPLSFGSS